jgi:hypothetical protein
MAIWGHRAIRRSQAGAVMMTRRELLGALGISVVGWDAAVMAQDKTKSAAKTAIVTLAISGMT